MIEVVFRKGEMGYWSNDPCPCCGLRLGAEFIPLKSGPETPEENRRARMIKQIYDPIVKEQITKTDTLLRGFFRNAD